MLSKGFVMAMILSFAFLSPCACGNQLDLVQSDAIYAVANTTLVKIWDNNTLVANVIELPDKPKLGIIVDGKFVWVAYAYPDEKPTLQPEGPLSIGTTLEIEGTAYEIKDVAYEVTNSTQEIANGTYLVTNSLYEVVETSQAQIADNRSVVAHIIEQSASDQPIKLGLIVIENGKKVWVTSMYKVKPIPIPPKPI